MNALIEQWGARNVGIVMLVLAAVVLVFAALIAWDAVHRGFGILAIDRAQAAALAEDRLATVAHGREAAKWLPSEATAGILAVDLSDPAAKDQLARVELRAPPKQRPAVAAIAALHQVHHGGTPAGSLNAGDQAVINHLVKLKPGTAPGTLTLPDADPPQMALLAYAAQARFRAAWQLGDRELIRTTAGEFRLLMPKHPDGPAVEVVLLALSPSVSNETVRAQANALPRGTRRDLVVLKLMELAPDRAAMLKPLIPTTGAGK